VVVGARANRAFLNRAVSYLAGPCSIQQFVDVGPSLPAPGNTYQVAQAIAPQSKVVYVDNDVTSRVVHTVANAEYDYYLGGCFL
jgi:S-adenosyl methyltransferase